MTLDAPSPISLATAQLSTVTPTPTAAEAEAFSRTLFGRLDKLPDEHAIEQFQVKAADINARIEKASATEEALMSPLHALAVQTRTLNAVAEVDLIAKAAGGISQAINKLTSLQ